MTKADLKPFAPWALIVGVGGALAAAVAGAMYREFNVTVQVGLIVGLAGFVVAVLLDPATVLAWLGLRQTRYGANVAVMTLALLGILVIVNYLAKTNPKKWDLTEGQVNTLAPQTIEAIQKLPAPVKAIGFYSTNLASQQTSARELLDRFKAESPGKFSYEFHDLISDPITAREYNVTRDGTLVLEMGDLRETLNFASETEITSALIRFTQPVKRAVYFLAGHGELSAADTGNSGLSQAADLLSKQNYEVRELNLQISGTVPSDARAVIIAGPLQPLSAEEVVTLTNYLNTPNAAMIVMADPTIEIQQVVTETVPDPLLEYLAGAWGIQARNDVIFSPNQSVQGQPFLPVVSDYGSSPIAEKLRRIPTIFLLARSLDSSAPAAEVTVTPLAQTDEAAWGETDFADLAQNNQPAFGEGDTGGPLTIGLAASNGAGKARLVVFGDSGFPANQAAQTAGLNLLVNSVNWVTLDETLINLTPKTPPTRSLEFIDDLTMRVISFFTVIVMPLSVLIMGGVVWFIRRRHA
jgi:ABC-type uncharacterized transport system involved in gliding motility auxiliary subunit